ncbi:MAG: phosphate ABC transporter substrate-binding protein [Planctomycetes bacterium]|nr:phosphate ABC transporter substrate-binding protein [Planctomycetota bacterium]
MYSRDGVCSIRLPLLLSLCLAGCGQSGPAPNSNSPDVLVLKQNPVHPQITVTGASTIAPLMNEIAKRFELQHPELRIDVQTGGSSRGVTDSRNGLSDIGMVSRSLKPDESDLQRFPLARDGVCLIVHSDNPVTSLTDEQVVSIYQGKTRNWKDVGGPDQPITVVNKAEGRSTLEVFAGHFKLPTNEIQADVVIGDNEQGVKTVAGNLQSIGYVSIGTAEFNRDAGVPIKLLPLAGIEASVKTVNDGTFPMSRTLHLVTKSKPTGIVHELIEFATSSKVHDLVKELSFVPIE